MKIFISHKDVDSDVATQINKYLSSRGIQTYLDVLDNSVSGSGKKLTQHLMRQLNQCTHLMTILSKDTRYSWWVPFEIGMASQRRFPIANYLVEGVSLPSFLEYWPRLKRLSDLDKYIIAIHKPEVELNKSFEYKGLEYSDQFHKYLKSIL
ncbi:toll/interleukin-1 receptor domain-containing protein [Metallumcola ferriviriculae]|uniref:Toll/interleukin-1 receptor domain-containing protein n=1 Tax=Metallumcola ferriviriculae TaxID=3039180 RepID=A0AAU0UMB1_9FIRM|nr:toll/interleukin-1 receptor domain-containing protein [Desulfitibacteraceae bacterium MK1]